MRLINNETLFEKLDWGRLIERIEGELRRGEVQYPPRHVHQIPLGDGEASLLIMPVWKPGEGISVKLATYFPENGAAGLPTIHAAAVRFDGANGVIDAVCDADIVTARRTAASSAIAARYLVCKDARRLLIVGTGQLAADVAAAHCFVRDYHEVAIWGRSAKKAAAVVKTLGARGVVAQIGEDLETEARKADVISTVTSASQPIIKGEWLRPGSHLDLVGSFRADMRESDDQAIRQACVFVDTENACLAGDLAQPLASGVLSTGDICGDLRALVTGAIAGRRSGEERTVFKSAGFALLDYAAMEIVAAI